MLLILILLIVKDGGKSGVNIDLIGSNMRVIGTLSDENFMLQAIGRSSPWCCFWVRRMRFVVFELIE
jgi:hypothetical protein